MAIMMGLGRKYKFLVAKKINPNSLEIKMQKCKRRLRGLYGGLIAR